MGYCPSLKRGDDAANAGAPPQSASEEGMIESPSPVPARRRKRARVTFCSHRDLPGSWRCFLSALMEPPPLFFPLGGVLSTHVLTWTLRKTAKLSNTWAQANYHLRCANRRRRRVPCQYRLLAGGSQLEQHGALHSEHWSGVAGVREAG
jgi:hypothetical protein